MCREGTFIFKHGFVVALKSDKTTKTELEGICVCARPDFYTLSSNS